MFDFQQKRKLRTWAKSRLVWVVLGVVTMFVGASAFSRYQIAKDMEERRITVETESVGWLPEAGGSCCASCQSGSVRITFWTSWLNLGS